MGRSTRLVSLVCNKPTTGSLQKYFLAVIAPQVKHVKKTREKRTGSRKILIIIEASFVTIKATTNIQNVPFYFPVFSLLTQLAG